MLSQGAHTQLPMQQPRSGPGTTQPPNASAASAIGTQPGQPPALPPNSHTQRPLRSIQTLQSGQFVLGDLTGRSLRGSKLTEQQTLDLIRTCIDNSRYYLSVGPVKRFWNCISEHVEERIGRSYAWQSCRAKVVSLTELRLSKLEEASRNGTDRGAVQETELDMLLDQWIDIQKQRQRLVEQQEQRKAELNREVAENPHQFCDHYLTSLGYGGNTGDGAQTTTTTTTSSAENRSGTQSNGVPGHQRRDGDIEMAMSEQDRGATTATADESQLVTTGPVTAASGSRRTSARRPPGITRHFSYRLTRPSTHRMSSRVREIAEAIDRVTSSFAVADDVAETDWRVSSLAQDVDNLKSAVNEMRTDIANLNSKLDRILERL
ncbi:hypothetical protein VTN31DRAFT_2211 [Thermomyces dupontii]|uniref:uncharacterized protein n=1 Tax=Talaromyces thermophilus TaxID=28565 RepID=UPI003742F761